MKKIASFLVLLCFTLMIYTVSLAQDKESQDNIYLSISKSELKNGEEFSFTINLANMNVSAFDINIYFDNQLFEYISGPENTNVIDGKVITSWYDETGGKNPKQNCELVKYTLKAKEIESKLISIQGEFYNAEGELLQAFTDGIEIVRSEDKEIENIELSEESKVPDNNSKLEILRLNHEGMTPVFSPDIIQYYFLTETLNELEVTAIPQNPASEVNITGNTNFKEGLNIISIEVISPDKTTSTQYKILITKTTNLEKANANLETLAIEDVTLEPEFTNNIYRYNATVSNTTQKLNILAIPEKINAQVEITGGENLKFGNNQIYIQVVAENGYTKKQYIVNVYKRNEEEQKQADEENKINIQKLNAILENEQEEEKQVENQENHTIIKSFEANKEWLITWVILVVIVVIITTYRIKKERTDKNKKSVR